MCRQKDCNWLTHLLGKCEHNREVDLLQNNIVVTRRDTNKELKEFNKQLNILIKDENIRVTLSKIKKVTTNV